MDNFSNLTRFTQLLKENLGIPDDDVIDSAMHNMLSQYSLNENTSMKIAKNKPNSCSKPAVEKPQIRKEIEEKSPIQTRPKINKKSEEYAENYIPIYKRVDDIIKKKEEDLKAKKLAEDKKKREMEESECTFKPNTGNKIRRNPAEFAEHAYNWQKKKLKDQANLAKQVEEEIQANRREKPAISKKSRIMTANRSTTPIYERLYDLRKKEEAPAVLTQQNRSITPRKEIAKSPNRNNKNLLSKENILNKSWNLDVSFDSSFSAKTSRITHKEEPIINNVEFTPNLCFLLKGLR
ncbi:unnamed protein product [Blepharisma stoltei]|uniref:Uncharacterized protein n=1 Tax=Blepharisma stoltei TaxID=1481888 RepID=A0AAU9K5T0_9CILI|nr:unnamed protein product [Blepharisma stoltei]